MHRHCRDEKMRKCGCERHKKCCCECFDYVIVGAGTAGCALAAKLSDKVNGEFKNSVLVLEAGENLVNDPTVLANNVFAAGSMALDPKYSVVYQAVLDPATRGPYSDGRLLGGSSAHNGLQCYRGAPKQYDEWAAETGETAWSYDNLRNNVMKPFEHYTPNGTGANLGERGVNGPLFITQEPPLDGDDFMQAFSTATNAPFVDDLNDPTLGVVGCGANQNWVTPTYLGENSIRSFSTNAYLTGTDAPDAVTPPNVIPPIVNADLKGLDGRKLEIRTNAWVKRVVFNSNNDARCVEYVINNKKQKCKKVKAKKEIILCAGTTVDAAILQRSGVADSVLLNSLGIPLVYHNPNVGENMENHYGAVAVMSGETIPLPRVASAFVNLSSTPALPAPYNYPDIDERLVQLFGANASFFLPSGIRNVLGITEGISIFNINDTPKSKGRVKIISADPFIEPEVELNLYSDGVFDTFGTDANKVVTWFKILKNIETNTGGAFSVLYPTPDQYTSDEKLFQAALDTNNFFTYHTSGTCRMAANAATGVCDGKLKVFGVNKLRVADCASVPTIETGNTAYQAFVVGLQCAEFILNP
jgi:choline dehydrogenase-like flavoprotein